MQITDSWGTQSVDPLVRGKGINRIYERKKREKNSFFE